MVNGQQVRLRKKRLGDAVNDYTWMQDSELAELDAMQPMSLSFSDYLVSYADELHHPDARRCRFAIETLDERHIGNCSYYNIDEVKGEAELGIMIGDRAYWDRGFGTDAVTTLLTYIFNATRLKRIYLRTLEGNIRAQRCFEKCGFTPNGRLSRDGHNFIIMEINRSHALPMAASKSP